MHRPLLRAPLRSIADSYCKSKFHKQHGERPRNVADKLEFFQPLTTLLGNEFLGCRKGLSTKSMQLQIVDALQSGERIRASYLLSSLGRENHSLSAADFVHILKYCAGTPDPLFVMETWKIMEEKEIGLNNTCYLLTMKALCEAGHLEEASNLIKFSGESRGIHPGLPVYNYFLGACAKMQSMIHADLCLELMESRKVGKDEITYSQLLEIAVCQQNLSAVHEIWEDYIKHYSPSIFPLQKFVRSFGKLKDLKSAYEILQYMVTLALSEKVSINKNSKLVIPIPSNDQLSSIKLDLDKSKDAVALNMDTCQRNMEQSSTSNMGIGKAGKLKVGLMNESHTVPIMKVLTRAFNNVMLACAQTKNCGLAEQLMLQMENLQLPLSSYTHNCFIRAVVSERGFRIGMDLLKTMLQKNMKIDDSTIAAVSVECSKALELDNAEALLDQITKFPNPHPINVFLAACHNMGKPERAVNMLAKTKSFKLQHEIRTYELLFSLFSNVNAPYEEGNMLSQAVSAKRIDAIERDMAKHGVQHNHLSIKYLIKALGAEGMRRDMVRYIRLAESLSAHTNTFYCGTAIYNTVLYSLIEAKESNRAIETFKNMLSLGPSPNAATYQIMIDCCCTIRCFKSACAIVSHMVRNGYTPQTMTYTVLIKVLLESGEFDEALNMLDRMSSEGIELDLLLFNTVLQQAWRKQRIDVIEFIVEQMHQNKIQPDPSTCHYVFSAYVERGFHSTAVEALQVLSMRMLCEEGDDTLQEKRIQFEDLILAEDTEPKSKIFHFTKDSEEKLTPESIILQYFEDSEVKLAAALLNLRWCAILGLTLSWSPDDSLWARRLSATYNSRKRVASTI